ncbi:MAG: macro domain-containing protein [Candidatus Altiarchaeota archaeon]|nr:macro domain-containing protein [Candidatus Altiarchaeota archaeon]
MAVKVFAKLGDITRERADAIVNPANSLGVMGGGVAWAIKSKGGTEIEKEAVEKAPTPVGKAIATTAGRLPARFVIHAPTMSSPAQRIGIKNIEKATYAALECASRLGVKSIAFPGMGTGVGGVSKRDAAEAMIRSVKGFISSELSGLDSISLIAFDRELLEAFEVSLKDAGM